MISRSRALRGAALFVFLGALLGFFVGQIVHIQMTPAASAEGAGLWKQVDSARQLIGSRFFKPVQDDLLMEGALRGMVSGLGDQHSVYFSPSQYTAYLKHFDDSFVGIGVSVEMGRDKKLTIIKPLRGSPAEKAGLRSGDKIIAVEGQDIVGLSLDDAVVRIRGDAGTTVRLTVEREGMGAFEVKVIRGTLSFPLEDHRMLADGIGYIQLYEFNTHAGRQVRDVIDSLRQEGMRALILDLRQNPGGLLTEALAVAEQLVPEGPTLYVVDRAGDRKSYESHSKGLGLPLAVLIDKGSASAAEIVAGAVKDRRVGTLVGERTYGKGSVQQFFDLPGGAGLKLTTQKYLTAGGISIDGVGIDPDLTVRMPDLDPAGRPIDFGSAADVQLKRAVELLNSR